MSESPWQAPARWATALLDVKRMGEADRRTISAGTSAIALMESAGSEVAVAIRNRWTKRPVTVLCGPGNNGGDGYVVARALADAGWSVRVGWLGARDHLSASARHHAERWTGRADPLSPVVLDGAELVVDALFGAGLQRALEGEAQATLGRAASLNLPIVSVDIPSGVFGDTGESRGAVHAALTVTFFRKKPGHLLLPGRLLCGELLVAGIGIAERVLADLAPDTFENAPTLWLADLPRAKVSDNKHSRGHALVDGGYPMTGAARMAAIAAARVGAGLTTVAVSDQAFPIYAAALTSVMVVPMTEADEFERLLESRRFSAVLIGPGAGTGETTRSRVRAALAGRHPSVIDADALTAFQDAPPSLFATISGPCVLTPHDGEFRRLFDPSGDKLTRTRAAARLSGAVVVLKGADTVVAAPDGRAVVNANAPPTLATGGAGDVLSGMILGLLAQGMDAFLAAAAGVWMHGAAATQFGPGLLAEDLPGELPEVLRNLAT